MRLTRFPIVLCTASIALVPQPAASWGAPGHIAVGKLGDAFLRDHPNAAAHVHAILGNLSLGDVGPWADCAKSVSADGFLPAQLASGCAPLQTKRVRREMVDFALKNWRSCFSMIPKEANGQPSAKLLASARSKGCHRAYHFTDIAIEQADYHDGLVGAHPYDLVHAINASIAVLKGDPAPAPFHFTCRQALMALVHYVGDLHQPLHVGAIYLRHDGTRIDPDGLPEPGRDAAAEAFSTIGGNSLLTGSSNLHSRWDTLSGSAIVATNGTNPFGGFSVPTPSGPVTDWAAKLATSSFQFAQTAYTGLHIASRGNDGWPTTFDNEATYRTHREARQHEQILTGGMRLGQILLAIWPDGSQGGSASAKCGANA